MAEISFVLNVAGLLLEIAGFIISVRAVGKTSFNAVVDSPQTMHPVVGIKNQAIYNRGF